MYNFDDISTFVDDAFKSNVAIVLRSSAYVIKCLSSFFYNTHTSEAGIMRFSRKRIIAQ